MLRKTTLWILVALLSLGVTQLCFAGDDTEIGFKADLRYRGEIDGRDFNSDTDMQSQGLLRFRLGTMVQRENVHGFLQLQYSDQTGWDSGILGQDMVDVHQAWLKVDEFISERLTLKAGRMEMAYGDERLVGSVGWSNVGRVFDGVVLGYECEKLMVDFFYTNQVERYTSGTQTNWPDDIFVGIWAEYKPLKLNLFALHNSNASLNTHNDFQIDLSRTTMGLHYMNRYESGFGALLDFAYQMGTETDFAAATETDIAAMLIVVAASYSLGEDQPWFKVGMDWATGDDPETEEYEAFNNLYYTGHKWRGMMDYFIASDPIGLRDIFLKAGFTPMENVGMSLAIHNFSSDQDFASLDDGSDVTGIGNEIDFHIHYSGMENISLCGGIGYFMPTEDGQGTDADGSMWGYIQLRSMMDYWLD